MASDETAKLRKAADDAWKALIDYESMDLNALDANGDLLYDKEKNSALERAWEKATRAYYRSEKLDEIEKRNQ